MPTERKPVEMTSSPKASFWTAAAVAAIALWASGAPTVVYPLYAEEWGLAPAVTSTIFAIYPLVLIPVLIVFGNLSDVIGRRAVILIGLTALIAGSVLFGLAQELTLVFVGRALMGAGVGLALSPATAAMIEFGGPHRAERASSTTTASTAAGLALATLVGGALVEYAPAPLHLGFWVLTVFAVITLVAAWFLPRHTPDEDAVAWRPRVPRIPRAIARPFVAGALALASSLSIGSVFLALGAQIAHDLVRSDNAFVDGAIISISAVVIGVVAVLTRKVSPRTMLAFGPFTTLIGLGLLVGAGMFHSLPLFIASSVVGGAGYSLLFSGGLGLLTQTAPLHHRAAVLSAAYTIGYLFQAATALGLGVIATSFDLLLAIEIGSAVIVALGLASFAVAWSGRRAVAPVAA